MVCVVGLLIFGFFPFNSRIIVKARWAQANQQMTQFREAVLAYEQEYGHIPLPFPSSIAPSVDTALRTDNADFALSLMGTHPGSGKGFANPRGIAFLDPHCTRTGRGGWDHKTRQLCDPWGTPFEVILDTNFDRSIQDPQAPRKTHFKSILIYSAGPDKNPRTWTDNILSH